MRLIIAGVAALAFAGAAAGAATAPSDANRAAIFKAADFKAKGDKYTHCEDDVTPSYTPGSIELEDLNGDGMQEAWVKESSTFCYGNTAEYFVLVGKDAKGEWRRLLESPGIATTLKTKSKGFPDIEVGGPGAGPFPVYRYNGKAYTKKK